mmetsp:Transcript_17108/g.30872  ORF Transcript_17108/g.30872 Transcript_17108/m.30872 type:complete len:511 (+) Transcript_17108:1238-2770(+)
MGYALVAHSNHFSCLLPTIHIHGPFPGYILLLVGNSFSRPRSYPVFPPWVRSEEQGEFFVVSNNHMFELLRSGTCSGIALAIVLATAAAQRGARRSTLEDERYSACQDAYSISLRTFSLQVSIACLVACFYFGSQSQPCSTFIRGVQFHADVAGSAVNSFIEIVAWAGAGLVFAKLCMMATHSSRVWASKVSCIEQHSSKGRVIATHFLIWCCWLVICLLFAGPGALYSIMRAVPGFVHMSRGLQWLLEKAVSLITAFFTSFCLPKCQKALRAMAKAKPRSMELLSVGKLVTAMLVPWSVHFLAHEHCIGLWTALWKPCQGSEDGLTIIFSHINFLQHIETSQSIYADVMMTRSDVCQRGLTFLPRKCVHAVLERCGRLFLGTLVHYAFTTPAVRMTFTSTTLKLNSLWVQLVFLWELFLIFGASVPATLALAVLVIVVHNVLLSVAHLVGLDSKDLRDNMAGMQPRASVHIALICSFAMQLCFASNNVLLVLVVALARLLHMRRQPGGV